MSPKNKGVEILIVEDSPTQAEQLRHLLEDHGHIVTVAANGKQALAAAQERKPKLVITDVLMPEMDGYTFCKQIKSDEKLEDISVILVTSLTSPDDILKGLECGADNFITKPYEEGYLLTRIEHILTSRRLPRQERVQFGAEIHFAGRRHFITAEQQQILGLLISTYEEAVRINDVLRAREKELARSYQSLQALYHLAEGLNEATSEKEVIEKALDRTLELPGVQAAWISLWEGESGFRIPAARGLPPALERPGAWEGDCLCRRKLVAGELHRVTNILECERLQQAKGDTRGLRCHASVPLWNGDQVVGVMNLAGPEQGLFDDEDLKTLFAVGSQLAVAIERTRLLEQLERKVEERTAALTAEIAERRRSEQALKESEERYRDLFENANDLIQSVDQNGRFLYVNRAWRETLGYSEEEIPNLSVLDVVHPDDQGDFGHVLQRLMAGAKVDRFEVNFVSKGGKEITLEGSINCRFLDGKPVSSRAIFRDITEHRALEEQFRQAQKMEAIGRLAGGIAHDFNNLLNVIMGYSDLLLESFSPTEPLRKKLEQIYKAAERAAALTRQLLAFSRRQVLEPKLLDLNAVVADMDKMLRRLIGEDIDLVSVLDATLGTVKADPSQIEQVIMNLAVNARDAMPQGGKLTIETANVELDDAYARNHVSVVPGRYVMLAVSDTGWGMDAETQSHIFEPFFTTKEPGKGTGLGLATVYGIVKQSGGSIWLYSEPGKGTTFKVYLPRVEEVEKTDKPAKVVVAPSLGSETVLLVEDEGSVRELVRETLEKNGYTVLEARDGTEALDQSLRHKGPIHLMVTDVVMPGMSGRELAKRLGPLRPGVKVLYMSGYSENAIVHHGVLDPGTALLQKPFRQIDLARKVREVLDEGKGQYLAPTENL